MEGNYITVTDRIPDAILTCSKAESKLNVPHETKN